jgi:hypothetical protein
MIAAALAVAKQASVEGDSSGPAELDPNSEEAAMMALMGFAGFDTTKVRIVIGMDWQVGSIRR